MNAFFDTSSLIKLYHSEKDSEAILSIFNNYNISAVTLSEITKIEFNSTIWKKCRTKEVDIAIVKTLADSFSSDYSKYIFIPLNDKLIFLAHELIAKYGLLGLRTLDAIQLASIVSHKNSIDFAVTSDSLLKSIILLEAIQSI